MAIDPYSPCPGGTGKKIKFCCPDLVGELEKIERMLGAEQRAACSDHVDQLLTKFPDRACLLSYKAALDSELGRPEKALATIEKYLQVYPDNPVALAELALAQIGREGGRAAVETLQRAIAAAGQQFPGQTYEALGAVAQALLAEGHVIAARGHLMLQIGLTQAQDPAPLQLLSRINSSPSIPLLFKQDVNLVECPPDALWKTDFNKAMEFAFHGAWLKAAQQLAELAEKAGRWPAIMRNLATLRAWMADTAGTIEALRAYATGAGVALDDAVEAEALAQLLDREAVDQIDVITLHYPIRDFEQLQARLFAHSQTPRMPIDLARLGTEDQPPPKGAYFVLDCAVPATGAGIAREQIPRVVGQAFVFGKQTDRGALLEVVTYRTDELDLTRKALAEVAGDALEPPTEEVSGQVPAVDHALSWNWRLPEDTPAEQRLALMAAERAGVLSNRWTGLPQKLFGGKAPAEVAPDPQYRVPLLAAILLLELSSDSALSELDYNALRIKLGLPTPEPVDPNEFPSAEVPLARLTRVDVSRFSDEALLTNFERAQHFRHVRALRRLAEELVRRPEFKQPDAKAAAYGVLAHTETDLQRAAGYLDAARKAAEAAGRSTAPWDLTELSLRIAHGDLTAADRVLHHIRTEHIREPGVAQALYQALLDAGVINPDGSPAMGAAAPAAAPGLVMPGDAAAAPAAQGSKIWTPGSEPAAGGGGKKSAIWTPE
jgi:tetratricopeptide (TPR) repeat protein